MKGRFLLLLLLVFLVIPVRASDTGVDLAMQKYHSALMSYDTSLLANLMHPEALSTFRGAINTALTGAKSSQAQQELLPLFAVSSLAAYKALSDRDAYRRLNEVIAKAQPQIIDAMKTSRMEIVNISINGGVAHVVYNLTVHIQGRAVTKEAVQKLKRRDDEWMLLLPPTASAAITGIEAKFK